MLKINIICIFLAFLIDMLIADPYNFPHPIRYMGKTIAYFERYFREYALFKYSDYERIDLKNKKSFISYIYYKNIILKKEDTKAAELNIQNKEKYNNLMCVSGYYIVLINIFIWITIPAIIFFILYILNKYVFILAYSFLLSQLLAAKGLYNESMKVYTELKGGNIEKARKAVSMIVGRDTRRLEKEGIIKATIETVAENLSDGVIAPLLYISLGGIFGGYLYKVVNTMDSMIGYKDEKYLYIGRAAARLDDIFNMIPSRLSAILMIISSAILRYNTRNALKIFLRDRFKHASPNSAQTEAVAAGALELELAGDAYYFGKLYKKESIGDAIKSPELKDILRVNILMYTSSLLALLSIGVIYFLILYSFV